MYPLFETICIKDGAVQNLEWHQKRYEKSFERFYSKSTTKNLLKDIIVPEEVKNGLYKLRIFYNEQDVKCEFEKYMPQKIETLKLLHADDLDYDLKYSDRGQLNDLLRGKENCHDILLTRNGKITDTSYANIVFTDGKKWFTPNTPLLEGTCRARLLAQDKIDAVDISIKDLKKFTGFTLINAMKDLNKKHLIKMESIIL